MLPLRALRANLALALLLVPLAGVDAGVAEGALAGGLVAVRLSGRDALVHGARAVALVAEVLPLLAALGDVLLDDALARLLLPLAPQLEGGAGVLVAAEVLAAQAGLLLPVVVLLSELPRRRRRLLGHRGRHGGRRREQPA